MVAKILLFAGEGATAATWSQICVSQQYNLTFERLASDYILGLDWMAAIFQEQGGGSLDVAS